MAASAWPHRQKSPTVDFMLPLPAVKIRAVVGDGDPARHACVAHFRAAVWSEGAEAMVVPHSGQRGGPVQAAQRIAALVAFARGTESAARTMRRSSRYSSRAGDEKGLAREPAAVLPHHCPAHEALHRDHQAHLLAKAIADNAKQQPRRCAR